ncbi:MAG: sigma-70 family RNA polymerase sigma factor [Planctomycetaceae bacterium]|jgi:RNA polymerase sigma-70 factor, ECF subfamily|nr:sigma-70 family RNA polymerase sigma factor [Planctomycetaceae bacterium]MBT4726403.1 sigma-70 family RNA polymerase sigma factor [Planctomycetaceae bacterium]MBT4846913.1 sigma-70 family RNA polymerase sigma factor [Planctomycetaceae bacterium]MBT5124682.1 sigma-70 family RNA polymerase sigma factor [Planctomycetaceae bacterium]MBT5884576.1 sigma-70 family RNA polymerase sigma factor [Planctomycetaceae bacterium]
MWPTTEKTIALLAQKQAGDDDAWNQLLDRHRKSLHRMIQLRLDRRIRQRVDVSDVLQDVLIEANRRIDRYLDNPIMDFHLWIRQIAKDRIIDAHRRHRVTKRRSVDREQAPVVRGRIDHSTVNLAAQLPDLDITPAAQAIRHEMALQTEAALELLPEIDKNIILMRHHEQLSNGEAAVALDVSEAAASMRYLRALKKLRSLMIPEEDYQERRLDNCDFRS